VRLDAAAFPACCRMLQMGLPMRRRASASEVCHPW
jgi:hypothetical protein